jgi:hypothetical protein
MNNIKYMKTGRTATLSHIIKDGEGKTLCGAQPTESWREGDNGKICSRCEAMQIAIDAGEPLLEVEPEVLDEEGVDLIFASQVTSLATMPAEVLVGEILPPEETEDEISWMSKTLDELRDSQRPVITFEATSIAEMRERSRAFGILFQRPAEVIVEGSWDQFWSNAKNKFIERAISGEVSMNSTKVKYFETMFEGESILLKIDGIRNVSLF